MLFLVPKVHAQICVGEPGSVQWECWRGIYEDQFSELTANEFFPQKPDVSQTLYSVNAPLNYDNYFGAKISGYIHVPTSGNVMFNVTGNSKVRFYLSTNSSPANMTLRAYTNTFTNEFEHTKYPEQTSSSISLNQNEYYYFELWYVESTGGDHCRLFWQGSFLPNQNWNVITAQYLNNVGCKPQPCPERNTACNDGNANTIDDKQDGHCNCVGKANTTNNCVGERTKVDRYRYDNIPGSSLNDLYLSPNFPAIPNFSASLPILGTRSTSVENNVGNLVQGYLTVPVSGLYKFNITGDDNVILFISSDDNPENKQAHQILVTGYTGMTEHNKYIYQSTSFLNLQAGTFYYFEVNHKEGTGSEHFGAFWQTPFTPAGVWKRIPSFYLYDYGCKIACIPQGTLCDDGDPFTNDDQYDNNCTCAGAPCSGPDCDSPLANYSPYEKCNVTDQLSNSPSNNWLSCTINENPNPVREDSHWIKYDLGERYELINAHVWNYNVLNETNKGFQSVSIDFSEDGVSWSNVGDYNWPLASGEPNYGGFVGPDLTGIFARYILITSMDGTATCRGIGKIAFKAVKCPVAGTLCDDQNNATVEDKYDNNCTCVGINLLVNECEDMNLSLGDSTLYSNVYSAVQEVTALSTIDNESSVGFVAGQSILLDVGFETMPNAVFVASIDPCDPETGGLLAQTQLAKEQLKPRAPNKSKVLEVIPVPNSDLVDIHFYVEKPSHVVLQLKDDKNILYSIADHEYINKGHYRKRIRTKRLNTGVHTVSMITAGSILQEKVIARDQIESEKK